MVKRCARAQSARAVMSAHHLASACLFLAGMLTVYSLWRTADLSFPSAADGIALGAVGASAIAAALLRGWMRRAAFRSAGEDASASRELRGLRYAEACACCAGLLCSSIGIGAWGALALREVLIGAPPYGTESATMRWFALPAGSILALALLAMVIAALAYAYGHLTRRAAEGLHRRLDAPEKGGRKRHTDPDASLP